jgi:hypothetical protein
MAGLIVAAKTIANFTEKASQLYEQKRSAVLAVTALDLYVRRWVRWTTRGRVELLDRREMPLIVGMRA